MTSLILSKDRSFSSFFSHSEKIDRICRTILFNKLENIKHGLLTIEDHSLGKKIVHDYGDNLASLKVKIVIHRSSFYSRVLLGGSIGSAESYVDGDWDTEELTALIQIFAINRELLQGIDGGFGNFLRPIQKIFHGLRSNTVSGSKKNIHAHYDIGNDFFKLFLDETMMYSCAFFNAANSSLKEASINKIKKICERLDLKKEDHLLEIGTGWGYLAIYAAKNYGCKVTTTTISKEQFTFATELVKAHGLEDKISVIFEDYRLLSGKYDKLVSVEMIEAVGLENLPTFFNKCADLLLPDGLMVLQAITIRDQFYEAARKSVDFIQHHIFPGSGIPSVNAMMNAVTKTTDLVLINQQDYAEDYAQTLLTWSKNLKLNQEEIVNLGYPKYLYRLWQFYFSYCEGGFRERTIGLSQMTLAKPFYQNRNRL
jgi:cyclopropane-fatty-acyl-phospholipid synthase